MALDCTRAGRRRGGGGRPQPQRAPSARLVLLGVDLLTDLLQRAPDQPRYVHLGDPDLLGDLRLRQSLEEAQVENHALPFIENAEPWREHRAVLRHVVLVLQRADRLERIELLPIVVPPPPVESESERVSAAGLECLEHLLLLHACSLRELGDRWRTCELDGQLLDELRQLNVELLEPARDAHRPALVAEVALDLADDVRRRVGRELDAAVDVEPVDRLDQPDRADLDEVIELLAAIGIPSRERAHERHVPLDQLFARLQVAVFVVAAQQNLVVVQLLPPSRCSSRFVSSTQCEPSRSSTCDGVTTASRIRPRPSSSPLPRVRRAPGRTARRRPELAVLDARTVTSRPSLGRVEQRVECELEVFESLEGEVEPRGEAAQHEMRDAVKASRQRRQISSAVIPPSGPLRTNNLPPVSQVSARSRLRTRIGLMTRRRPRRHPHRGRPPAPERCRRRAGRAPDESRLLAMDAGGNGRRAVAKLRVVRAPRAHRGGPRQHAVRASASRPPTTTVFVRHRCGLRTAARRAETPSPWRWPGVNRQ